ncbi:hypothetical protein ACHAPJ_004935 [Fusarium lateritium]
MSGSSHNRPRPLLPAAQQQPPAPIPRHVLPRHPRVGVSVACENCRKRKIRCNGGRPRCAACARTHSECIYTPTTKDHELQRKFDNLETEKTSYQKLIDLLRSREHGEANLILDLLRQNTSVHDVLRQYCYRELPLRVEFWNPHTLGYRFLAEARRLWEVEEAGSSNKLTTLQAGLFINVIYNLMGADSIGWRYTLRSVEIAHSLDLFNPLSKVKSRKSQHVRDFTAWALFSWQSMHYYYVLINLQKPVAGIPPPRPAELSQYDVSSSHPGQDDSLDAYIRLETLLRVYYLRHGFGWLDMLLLDYLVFLAFTNLHHLEDSTDPAQLESRQSTLLLAAKGVQEQGHIYFLAMTMFQLIYRDMKPKEVDLFGRFVTMGPVDPQQEIPTEFIHSQRPIKVTGLDEQSENKLLDQLVKEHEDLSLGSTEGSTEYSSDEEMQ